MQQLYRGKKRYVYLQIVKFSQPLRYFWKAESKHLEGLGINYHPNDKVIGYVGTILYSETCFNTVDEKRIAAFTRVIA